MGAQQIGGRAIARLDAGKLGEFERVAPSPLGIRQPRLHQGERGLVGVRVSDELCKRGDNDRQLFAGIAHVDDVLGDARALVGSSECARCGGNLGHGRLLHLLQINREQGREVFTLHAAQRPDRYGGEVGVLVRGKAFRQQHEEPVAGNVIPLFGQELLPRVHAALAAGLVEQFERGGEHGGMRRQDEIPHRRGYDRGCIHRANPLSEDGNRLIHPPHMSGVHRCSPEFVERRECRPVAIWRGIALTGVGQDALPKRHRDEPLGTVTAHQRRGPEPLASLLPMPAVQGAGGRQQRVLHGYSLCRVSTRSTA